MLVRGESSQHNLSVLQQHHSSEPWSSDPQQVVTYLTFHSITSEYFQPLTTMIVYILAALVAYCSYTLICLELNYQRARSMKIPLVRIPIDPLNIPFQVLEPHVFKLLDRLPSALLPSFVPYLRRGWFFLDKATSHIRYGHIYALVSPGGIHIQVSDADAIGDIFARRTDFIRPTENYSELAQA